MYLRKLFSVHRLLFIRSLKILEMCPCTLDGEAVDRNLLRVEKSFCVGSVESRACSGSSTGNKPSCTGLKLGTMNASQPKAIFQEAFQEG